MNYFLLGETYKKPEKPPEKVLSTTLKKWRHLLQDSNVRVWMPRERAQAR
jgi:hypothetical protein